MMIRLLSIFSIVLCMIAWTQHLIKQWSLNYKSGYNNMQIGAIFHWLGQGIIMITRTEKNEFHITYYDGRCYNVFDPSFIKDFSFLEYGQTIKLIRAVISITFEASMRLIKEDPHA